VEESWTLYLQYNRGQNASEPMASMADRAFRLMDQGEADRLVVDVRHNGGGDSQVDDHLIEGIQSRSLWRQRGRLYCLIGGETFSSGLWTADDLRKLGAILVGSPTGGKPNSYGNVSTLQLPHSLLQVSYSTRYCQLISGSDLPWLGPDLAVEPTIADLRARLDPLLDAAVADRRQPLPDTVAGSVGRGHTQSGLTYPVPPPHSKYPFTSRITCAVPAEETSTATSPFVPSWLMALLARVRLAVKLMVEAVGTGTSAG
jgi:hypothetical protein